MDHEHHRGRPRSVDSILMAIKAIVMEALASHRYRNPDNQELLRRILATYGHGTKFALGIYLEKIKEVEKILHDANSKS